MKPSEYETFEGAHPSIQINVLRRLSTTRYVLALKRIRGIIAAGCVVNAYDCTIPGNKNTECDWGFCSESQRHWPDTQDHVFPVDFQRRGRSSPLAMGDGQKCPIDWRAPEDITLHGCFYSCRIFQAKRGETLTRDEALALYDNEIARFEQ